MSDRRYKSEFPFWKSPYYNSSYRESVTDEQITKHASNALIVDRRGRVRPATRARSAKPKHSQEELTLSGRESRLKREITREICNQLLGSVNICIPIPAVSAPPRQRKQSKSTKKADNEQLIKLQKDIQEMQTNAEQLEKLNETMQEMKIQADQQDELIQNLRRQIEESTALTPSPPPTPPSKPIRTIIPTMPYAEDLPSIDLSETTWG